MWGLSLITFALLLLTTVPILRVSAYALPFTHLERSNVATSLSRRWWLSSAADKAIEAIWPPLVADNKPTARSSRQPSPPPKLLARYSGDVVLRFNITSHKESEALAEAVNTLLLDVWDSTSGWVDIRLSKDTVSSLLGLLPSSLQTAHTPLIYDLSQAILESYPALALESPSQAQKQPSAPFDSRHHPATGGNDIFFRQYQPLSVIIPWMRLLRSLFPSHVRLISLGLSYEGRELQALRVGVHPTNNDNPSEPRKTIVVMGGSHAREWISVSTVNYVAYSFITGYGRSKEITNLLEKFDFVFIPTINPDGYVFTWEHDRLWRKNRQQTGLRFCMGLDLDHSFGYEWEDDPDKTSPCSETFAGEAPFEAIEAYRVAQWIKNETVHSNVEVAGFLDLHSYSQQVLYPYSFSCVSTPPSLENLEELAFGLAKAIRTATGENYGVTSACEGNVPAFSHGTRWENGRGSALDWFYHELKVQYAYQLKLRDTGTYGFLLPSADIVPTGKEAFQALTYFGNFLIGNKGIEQSQNGQGVHDGARVRLTHPKDQKDFDNSEWVVVDHANSEASDTEFSTVEELRRK